MVDVTAIAVANKYLKGEKLYGGDQVNTFKSKKERREEREGEAGLGIAIVILYYSYVVIVGLIVWIGVIVMAVRCNPQNEAGYGILAAVFSGVYLAQWLVKRVMLKQDGYCVGV